LADRIRETRLDCGIRVVTESMPDVHSVTTGFWVDAGSRDETGELAGASHFLEHLLFKGTDARSARDIAEAIEAVGGDMNAFTTKEYTAFYTRVLDTDVDLSLDILSDIMWAPAFRVPEVEAERQVILEEILMHEDEPADLVHDVFTEALYPGHPLGREVLGDARTISAMSPDQIRSYFSDHYRPEAIVVAAAGALDHDHIADGVAARFRGPDGHRPSRDMPPLAPSRRVVVNTRATEQAHVVVGARALPRDDDDRFALAALNQVLGGGMSSRLFQEIREERGLVYSVYSYRAAYIETGALAVYAGTSPGQVQEVLALVDDQLDSLASSGVTPRELDMAKGHLRGSLALSLEDSASRMTRVGRGALLHDHVMTFEELVERSDAVTRDDVSRVAQRVLGNDRVLAVVGPFEEDEVAELVA
jgi:predicted Zn-dependent peptidase